MPIHDNFSTPFFKVLFLQTSIMHSLEHVMLIIHPYQSRLANVQSHSRRKFSKEKQRECSCASCISENMKPIVEKVRIATIVLFPKLRTYRPKPYEQERETSFYLGAHLYDWIKILPECVNVPGQLLPELTLELARLLDERNTFTDHTPLIRSKDVKNRQVHDSTTTGRGLRRN